MLTKEEIINLALKKIKALEEEVENDKSIIDGLMGDDIKFLCELDIMINTMAINSLSEGIKGLLDDKVNTKN